jgi:xanthine phosphoribosyltransferase
VAHYTEDIYISWDELQRDTRRLCEKILELGETFESIIAVTRGGLIPAAIVARELDIRLVDTICVATYRGNEAQVAGEADVLKAPDGTGKGALLIDDLVDTGRTGRAIRERLPDATFATVYAKPEGEPLVDLVVRTVPQKTWIRFPWDTALAFARPLVDRGE